MRDIASSKSHSDLSFYIDKNAHGDLFFYINDNLTLRFIGNGNAPYTHLPLTFWMFERQFTGNNCFAKYKPKCNADTKEYVRQENDQKFYFMKNHIIPEITKLPTSEEQFNKMIKGCGLSYLADMLQPRAEILLEDKASVMSRDRLNPYEIHRFSIDDICTINKAYQTLMNNTNLNIIRCIYECIVNDVNAALSKQQTI